MRATALGLTALVAALHVAFAIAEIFYWQHPAVMARFGNTADFARQSATLAGNIGVYNALVAASLVWALVTSDRNMRNALLLFVIIAGIYGALTAKPAIFFVQSLPAILALAATMMSARHSQD